MQEFGRAQERSVNLYAGEVGCRNRIYGLVLRVPSSFLQVSCIFCVQSFKLRDAFYDFSINLRIFAAIVKVIFQYKPLFTGFPVRLLNSVRLNRFLNYQVYDSPYRPGNVDQFLFVNFFLLFTPQKQTSRLEISLYFLNEGKTVICIIAGYFPYTINFFSIQRRTIKTQFTQTPLPVFTAHIMCI